MVTILNKIKHSFFSIRWQLVLSYFIIIYLALFLVIVYISSSVENYFLSQKIVEVSTRANVIADFVVDNIKTETTIKDITDIDDAQYNRVVITDKDSTVLFDSAKQRNLETKTFAGEEVLSALKGKDYAKGDIKEGTINVAVPIIREQEVWGVVYISYSIENISRYISDIKSSLYQISIIINVCIGVVSFIFAGIFTGQIKRLTETITHVAEGRLSLDNKIEVTGKNEISELSLVFNKMTDKLAEQEEKRQQFVSDASHELKTPLSSIKVLASSILETEQPGEATVKEFLIDINSEVDRLSKIIDKLLILTKMDSHENNELNLKSVSIKELIKSVLKVLRPLAKKNQIRIEFDAKEDIIMSVDEDKIWRAVFNIVDNAIKYSSGDELIKIGLRVINYEVEISIEDSGIGIAEDYHKKIFERFYRIDKARARETGGTGLGLAISLAAVRMHDGDIKLISEENKGSTFIITFPVKNINEV